jgi:hypothetical protein
MHRFFGSVASRMSSFTRYSTLSAVDSLSDTPWSALVASAGTPSSNSSSTCWAVTRRIPSWLPWIRLASDSEIDLEATYNVVSNVRCHVATTAVEIVRYHFCNGSYLSTSRIVRMTLDCSRNTRSVSSEHLRKTPSIPVMPKPSMMSLVSRNGIVSGNGSSVP